VTEESGAASAPDPNAPLGEAGSPADPSGDRTYTSEEYRKIQDEAAQRRIANRELEERFTSTVARLLDTTIGSTCKDLQDPTDLLVYTSRADLLGDDGLPDELEILQAEADLLKAKPHLKSRRPKKTFEQGPQGEEQMSFSFNDWLRGAAG
jgi:hypothetical protein